MNKCQIQKIIFLCLTFSKIFLLSGDVSASPTKYSYLSKKIKDNNISKDINNLISTTIHESNQFLTTIKNTQNINSVSNQIENFEKKDTSVNEVLIESKVQSEKNNILYAEEDVIVRYKGNILKVDKLLFDKKNKVLKAEGNIQLKINNQIFKADEIEYDFVRKIGYFKNLVGFINLDSIISDFDSESQISYENFLSKIPSIQKDKITYTPQKNTNWIFSTKYIKIDQDKWSSKKAFLTNDLLGTNQIKIQLNQFEVFPSKDKFNFNSKINYVILEDKITIPFWFGNRTISKKSKEDFSFQNRWNTGYDEFNNDGFFIGRKLNSIELGNKLALNIEPQFLLQRALKGKTKSFVQKNYSINSPKVERNISLSDYFALSSSIQGKINDWDLKITKELYSFDLNEFANAFRTRAELSKEIKLFNGVFFNRIFGAYRERVWNGSIGESEVYKAYGLQINQANNWKDGSVKRNQTITFGLGNYEAEELNSSAFANSYKGSINYQFNQKVPLHEKRIDSEYIDRSFEYIPKPIRQGFYINSNIAINYSLYEDDKSQQYLGVGIGPEMIIGDYKRKFFDYTHIKIQPFYKFKSGKSIFKFDQVSDKFTMDLNFDQHLVGPLLIETKATINLDKDSNHFGDFINSRIGINFKKRSYSFGVFYQPHNQAGGINFNLNGFK